MQEKCQGPGTQAGKVRRRKKARLLEESLRASNSEEVKGYVGRRAEESERRRGMMKWEPGIDRHVEERKRGNSKGLYGTRYSFKQHIMFPAFIYVQLKHFLNIV